MVDPSFSIRPYRADDTEDVIAVWQRANALAHPFLSADFVADVHKAMRDIYLPNAETYVLAVRGAVIGFVALVATDIGGLFLDPAWHGRGFGRALVDHAFALKGPLTVEVFRDNAIGRAFYERYGFVMVADALHEPSGHVSRKMAMPGA
ncbi:GNAT family N-acetyltransferase [uncultured Tateyamaria sp.]|uniref:GNAT family N-acetyltransferase n=1 Tax=uncultured Tateyamaria sp. TaxID=455651 RepID=UPI0026272065|nr:GNAT family N-acetyltransferase [uncultured Tateyamaria sp.]